ncbi:M48 family metallopeptidase [Brevundimonas kwangchunensis]|uniref:M48 family metallopeptidase n=1 Tax=Brevundimonas kwangchunensis TaxID=322163 RepID=A0ABP3S3P1_9CAUL
MAARFYDGHSARSHPADVVLIGDMLEINADSRTIRWKLRELSVQIEGDDARVSSRKDRDARLVMSDDDWARLAGDRLDDQKAARRRREIWLVGGLTAAAAGIVLFVTVGVPALAKPIAKATPIGLEEQMGRNFDAQIGAVFPRCEGEAGQRVLADLGHRLAARADTPFDIRVRAVEAPMINAFALPGGPVMVTDDLIAAAETPDELAAVIAHEISHVEQRHVMQAVWRDFGIGMLLDAVVGGGTGAGQQAVILAGQASSLSYDRAAEREADARGQALLHAEGLSSEGMAAFFERLGKMEGSGALTEATEFLNTHPDSGRRARAARAIQRPGAAALTAEEWATVKATCSARSDGPIDRLQRRFRLGDRQSTADQGDQVRPD